MLTYIEVASNCKQCVTAMGLQFTGGLVSHGGLVSSLSLSLCARGTSCCFRADTRYMDSLQMVVRRSQERQYYSVRKWNIKVPTVIENRGIINSGSRRGRESGRGPPAVRPGGPLFAMGSFGLGPRRGAINKAVNLLTC